jgi:hypothetical protein
MHFSIRAVPAIVAALIALNAPALNAAPKVDALVVGPANAGGIYTLSPQGGHIAYVGMKGTKVFVSVDGIDGPVFDELFGPNGQGFYNPPKAAVMRSSTGGQTPFAPSLPVIFSPDGSHFAYAGRIGNDYVVIHDGNEIARGPRAALALNYGPLTLSPTGRHVYWDEMKTENSRGSWRLMMTGKPGPWSGHQTMNPVFSADDSRYAYNAGKIENYQDQMLIVDGKEAGYSGRDPVFTADGKSLFSIRYSPKAAVLIDGKPVLNGISVDKIIPAPVGHRWGAIIRTKLVNSMGVASFFLDGKEVPGTEGAKSAWFSADGKHYAVSCINAQSRAAFMVVDGKAGEEYQSVTDSLVKWTPDGSKVIYTVVSGGRNFIVVNNEAFPIDSLLGYNPIVMPETGNHYVYGTNDGTNRIFSVILDDKSVLLPSVYPVYDTLTMSADGSRYGYFFGPVGRSEVTGIAIDGAVAEGLAPIYFAKWVPTDLIPPSIVFSRDGKHVAYQAHGVDPQTRGIYLDGKLAAPKARGLYFPTFTPDSQHFFFTADEAAAIPGQVPPIVVYVDGHEAVRANGYFFASVAGNWTMDANGTLTFFAADGDTVKRYRVTASPETGIATMIAETSAAQAKALADAAAQKKAAEEAAAKAKADKEAAAAKAKADYDAAVAAKAQARQDAIAAKKKAAADAAAAKAQARQNAINAKKQGR